MGDKNNMWVGASEAVQRLHPGSAGVSPAWIRNGRGVDSKSFAGETPALPGRAFRYFATVGQPLQPRHFINSFYSPCVGAEAPTHMICWFM
jgi:hypothetical protein